MCVLMTIKVIMDDRLSGIMFHIELNRENWLENFHV